MAKNKRRENKARERVGSIDVNAYNKIANKLNTETYTTRDELIEVTGLSDVKNRKIIKILRWDKCILSSATGGYKYAKPIEEDVNNEDYKAVCSNIVMLNRYIESLKMDIRMLVAYKKMAEKIKPELLEKKKK